MKLTACVFTLATLAAAAAVITTGTPARVQGTQKYMCEKTWTLVFPAGLGDPLYCGRFEDGGERCSPEAADIPIACGNPAVRDNLLILR